MKYIVGHREKTAQQLSSFKLHRLVSSFVTVCGIELCFNRNNFTDFEYFKSINPAAHLSAIAGLFLALTVLNRKAVDRAVLAVSTLIYCVAAAAKSGDFYTMLGCSAVACAVSMYLYKPDENIVLSDKTTKRIVLSLGLFFAIFTGSLTIVRYLSHLSPCYDFGIFAQMFHNMREGFLPMVTCERDGLLSHFAVHFSPIFYLLLPLYLLIPTPATLLAGQSLILASGLIPLFLICRKRGLSNGAIAAISALYILLPSMAGGTFFYLHENKFLTPLLLWLIYYIERDKTLPTLICAVLVLIVKEDAPVYVALLALYFIVSKRAVKKGAILFVLSASYFAIVVSLMGQYGEGVMNYRYENYIYDSSDSLITVIRAVLLNPIYVIEQSFTADKLKFLLQMLVPLAFLPLIIKKPARIILLFPLILINLMSDYVYQHNIGFQYTYGSAAFLLYLLILNYGEISVQIRRRLLIGALTCAVVFFGGLYLPKLGYIYDYAANIETHRTIEKALAVVPQNASVKASTFLVANLYDHSELYELESSKQDTEYIVVDLRFKDRIPQMSLEGYERVYFAEGVVAVYRSGGD